LSSRLVQMRLSDGFKRRARVYALILGVIVVLSIVFDLRGCLEHTLAYFPIRASFTTPTGYEDVTFTTEDGLTLHGWFMPARGSSPESPAPAVLHVHGNAGNVSYHDAFSNYLPRQGISVFLFDYRSFGRSDRARGRLNRYDLARDTNAALDYLLSRPDVDPDRIALYGVSLGAAIGIPFAAEREEVRAVVALAPFASWKRVARSMLWILGSALARSGMDPIDSVGDFGDRPVLFVHGQRDVIIPISHSRDLHEAAVAAGVPSELLEVRHAGHNDLLIGDRASQRAVVEFLKRVLGEEEPEG
jgi:uncharacterized protein